jgi:hypothetical protein
MCSGQAPEGAKIVYAFHLPTAKAVGYTQIPCPRMDIEQSVFFCGSSEKINIFHVRSNNCENHRVFP